MASFSRESTGVEIVKHLEREVEDKTIVITGASVHGLGAETALSLAHASPAHLILLGRSATKIDPVIAQIKELNSRVQSTFVSVDLDDFESVRKAGWQINNAVDNIDILINNAGIMGLDTYQTNKSGIELQFATNHLGHFLLTKLLFSKIAAAGPGARIVNVTSDGYMIGPVRLDDYNFSQKDGKDYDPWSGYGQSKTANILFTRQLATKLGSRGILSFAVHPGVIMDTSLANHIQDKVSSFGSIDAIARRNTGKPFYIGKPKTTQQGVSTILVAALDPSLTEASGSYLEDCAVKPLRAYASSPENAQALWSLSETLVGETFELCK